MARAPIPRQKKGVFISSLFLTCFWYGVAEFVVSIVSMKLPIATVTTVSFYVE
jgi:hypothetical protein